jgi:hypothetical protein
MSMMLEAIFPTVLLDQRGRDWVLYALLEILKLAW